MKKCVLFIALVSLLGSPIRLDAAEDKYGTGKLRDADPDTFISLGVPLMTFPATGETKTEETTKLEEKKKQALDSKVDDAIKKAWGEK
ncbi:MAG: hypothetical protein WAW37_06685 [Syntrophobacteraceae bacterium]